MVVKEMKKTETRIGKKGLLPPTPYPLLPVFPCACLLDSVKDTPLFTNWLMLFVGGLFFLGAAVALFLAWKRGYLDFKAIEEVKYKVMEDGKG